MKKLFMFLLVAGFAAFGVSCGNDDNAGGNSQEGQKTLTLKAGKVNAKVGDKVPFTVNLGSATVAGAGLYIDNKKVANPYTFDQVGEFNVVAKKKGFNDSNVVKIKVTDGEASLIESVLFLTAIPGASEIGVGQELTFVFTDVKGDLVEDVQLLKDGVGVVGNKYVVTSQDAGKNLKFTAKKDELTSNEVVYSVTALPPLPKSNFVKVGTSWIDLKSVGLYYFKDESGSVFEITDGGKKYTLFRATAFNEAIEGNIKASYHDNSVGYYFAVEVRENGRIRYPWGVDNSNQVKIANLTGFIDGVNFKVENADFYDPIFENPNDEGIGNVVLRVEKGTDVVSGLDVELQFDGLYDAIYSESLPAAPRGGSSDGHAKSLNFAKYAEDIQSKDLKQIRIK